MASGCRAALYDVDAQRGVAPMASRDNAVTRRRSMAGRNITGTDLFSGSASIASEMNSGLLSGRA